MTVISRDAHDISGLTAQRPTNAEPGILYQDTTLNTLCVAGVGGIVGTVTGNIGSPGAVTAAAGNSQSTAGVLPSGTSNVYQISGSDNTKGVQISAADTVTGRVIILGNQVNNKTLIVYPQTGGTINGGAANASWTGISGAGMTLYCANGASGGTWHSI